MTFTSHYKSLLLLSAALLLLAGPAANAKEPEPTNSILLADNGKHKNWDRARDHSQRKEMRDRRKEMRENERDRRREWREERRNDRNNWRKDRREERYNWREERHDYRQDGNNGLPNHNGRPEHRPDIRPTRPGPDMGRPDMHPNRPGPDMGRHPEPARPGAHGKPWQRPEPPRER